MTYKKCCTCGWVVSGTTAKATAEALLNHCEYTKTCDPIEAKNV